MAETSSSKLSNLCLAKIATPGIALSSGGALGLSHIGVLRAFTSKGIHFPMITGTSIGAIVGAAYACGTLDMAEQMAKSLTRQAVLQWADLHWDGGLLKGDVVEGILRKLTKGLAFEDLSSRGTTLVVVACDLNTGQPVYLSEGDIAHAVRASISIPGVFVPVAMNGSNLVDGGLVDNVPVDKLSRIGADFTVAVDVSNSNDMWSRAKSGIMISAKTANEISERIRAFAAEAASAGSNQIEKYQRIISNMFAGDLRVSSTTQTSESSPSDYINKNIDLAKDDLDENTHQSKSNLGWAGIKTMIQSAEIMNHTFDLEQEGKIKILKPDVLLRPKIRPYHAHQFYKAEKLIEAGEIAVRDAFESTHVPLEAQTP